eukprot:2457106-Alexandrium_andersonii.AAC.1
MARQMLSGFWPDDVPVPQGPLPPGIERPPAAPALTEEQRAALRNAPPPAAAPEGASASSVDAHMVGRPLAERAAAAAAH